VAGPTVSEPAALANVSSGFGRQTSILVAKVPFSASGTPSSKKSSVTQGTVSIPVSASPPAHLRETFAPSLSPKHSQIHSNVPTKQRGQGHDLVASTFDDSPKLRLNSGAPHGIDNEPADLLMASDSDDDMEEVLPSSKEELGSSHAPSSPPWAPIPPLPAIPDLPVIPPLPEIPSVPSASQLSLSTPPHAGAATAERSRLDIIQTFSSSEPRPQFTAPIAQPQVAENDSEEEIFYDDWSRSPSPALLGEEPEVGQPESSSKQGEPSRRSKEVEDWDAAQEMDPIAEEDEFAKFLSQVKGKDLGAVQQEIEQEITSLNQQRKAASRDSDDITQHMISQIMVRLSADRYVLDLN
jgi:hypothetical protein